MNKVITVSGVDNLSLHACRIEVDEYVPLRFRTSEHPLGAKYVRFGSFRTSLLELLTDSYSLVVRGLTLTCFDALHPPRVTTELHRITGLPILASAQPFEGPIDAQRIDVVEAFTVGFGENFVEIELGGLSDARTVIVGGPAKFYVTADGYLAGIRVVGLTQQQLLLMKTLKL